MARAATTLVFVVSLGILVLPFLWANPFNGEGDGACERSGIVETSLVAACLISGASGWSVATLLCLSDNDGGFLVWCIFIGFPVLAVMAVVLIMSFILLCLAVSSGCTGDSMTYPVSVNSLVLFAGLSLLYLIPSCGHCLSGCCASRGRDAGRRAPAVRKWSPTRAQQLLRDACALGDAYIVDQLLDIEGRRDAMFWRLQRCIFLACCMWQCRPSRSVVYESAGARRSAARARLDLKFEDDDGSTAVHYLALGRWHAAVNRHRQHGVFRFFGGGGVLPKVTDPARSRLFAKLVASGHISPAALLAPNASGRTPLHCAALTGSTEMIGAIYRAIQQSGKDGVDEQGDALCRKDDRGDTPLDLALRSGQLAAALALRDVSGSPAAWHGLSNFARRREQVLTNLCECSALAAKPAPATPAASPESVDPLAVLEDHGQVLLHLRMQVATLQTILGSPLPDEAAHALLRHHDFNVSAAAQAYERDARGALAAAGLDDVPVASVVEPRSASDRAGGAMCIVCMEAVDRCSLPCGHMTCGGCLAGHVRARIEEADINGLVCPWPSCRVAISDGLAEEVLRRPVAQEHDEDGAASPDAQQREVEGLLARLRSLRAQSFVNTAKGASWCPRPGCGHVVCSLGDNAGSRQHAARTVQCSCGTQFCPQCHEVGGHAPADCRQWSAWKEREARDVKDASMADAKWMAENAQQCPKCGAQISRNGGCNHMICRSCLTHFCYVCGGDWDEHRRAPGGLDYYRCRFAANPTRPDAPERAPPAAQGTFEACHGGFRANARDAAWERGVAALVAALAELFGTSGDAFREFLPKAVESSLEARRILQFSYVLKFQIGEEGRCSRVWRTRLSPCIAELEGACAKLESIAGLSDMAAAARAAGLGSAAAIAEPERRLEALDLREAMAHVAAVAPHLAFAAQLSMAVRLQAQRLLSEGRAYHELSEEERLDAGGWVPHISRSIGGGGGSSGLAALGSFVLWGMRRLVGANEGRSDAEASPPSGGAARGDVAGRPLREVVGRRS